MSESYDNTNSGALHRNDKRQIDKQPDGSAAVIVAEGYHRLKEENERLKEWIREEGIRTDTCTYNILGEICKGCRCKRQPQQNVESSPATVGAERKHEQ